MDLRYKVVITGDPKVGKSTFIDRFVNSTLLNVAMPNTYVRQITCQTSKGLVILELWESNHESDLQEAFYQGMHCGIIMFDVLSRDSYKNTPLWYEKLTLTCPTLPVIFLGNKVDQPNRKVTPKQINFPRRKACPYYELSATCNYQIQKVINKILRLLEDPTPQVTPDHDLLIEDLVLKEPAFELNIKEELHNHDQFAQFNVNDFYKNK